MSFGIHKIFEKTANEIVRRLQSSYYEKDMVATGETVRSIRAEAFENGFKIWGGDWIEFSEYGRGPAKGSGGDFLDRLTKWAKARGFPEAKVAFLKYLINKQGTRLWRGQDSRFSGRQSKVLTDVLNEDLEKELQETLMVGVLLEFKTYIRKIYE